MWTGKTMATFALGAAIGATSWVICPLVSPHQEPFDTGAGFLLGQSLMAAVVAVLGWRLGFAAVSIATLGCYFGQLAYIWMLGGESRAWFALGMVTIIPLCVLPLLAGGGASLVARLMKRRSAVFYEGESVERSSSGDTGGD